MGIAVLIIAPVVLTALIWLLRGAVLSFGKVTLAWWQAAAFAVGSGLAGWTANGLAGPTSLPLSIAMSFCVQAASLVALLKAFTTIRFGRAAPIAAVFSAATEVVLFLAVVLLLGGSGLPV